MDAYGPSDWVQAFKEPCKEIKENNGKFYLYERSTVYDKERKQDWKITGGDLGRITEDGFIAKKSAIVPAVPVVDLEYGASSWAFLNHISLIMIYRLYVRMKEADMLNRYSVKDCLFFLYGIRKQQQGKKLETALRTKKTDKILSLLRCDI